MRIAWLGPTPNDDGGAPYVGTQLLRELARAGAEVDCFLDVGPDQIPAPLLGIEGLRFVLRPTSWKWGSWYNRAPLMAFVSGKLFRLRAQFALAQAVARRHATEPYDVVYQFSQCELGGLRSLRDSLPPIVVHPSTHAAGELRWYKREARLARGIEPRGRRAAGADGADVPSGDPAARPRPGRQDRRDQPPVRRPSGQRLPDPARADRDRRQPDRPRALLARTAAPAAHNGGPREAAVRLADRGPQGSRARRRPLPSPRRPARRGRDRGRRRPVDLVGLPQAARRPQPANREVSGQPRARRARAALSRSGRGARSRASTSRSR